MKQIKRFFVGLAFGGISMVGLATILPSNAYADWILQCDFTGDGNAVCCTINTDDGSIGDCRVISGS